MKRMRIFWQVFFASLAITLSSILICATVFYRVVERFHRIQAEAQLDRDGELAGVVPTARPLVEMQAALRGIEKEGLWAVIAVMTLAVVLSGVVSRRICRPLERIQRGAERFASGELAKRLQVDGSVEIRSLAETLNVMAGQLDGRLRALTREIGQREAVLSSMVEGVLAVDGTGRIVSMNTAVARSFKVFRPETAPGRTIEEVFRNVRLQRFIAEVLEADRSQECEIEVKNDRSVFLQAHGTHLYDADGLKSGAIVVFNDISSLRRLETLRRDFVANVSHELKTPITAIKGFVETLLDGAISRPGEAESFLKIILKHTDRLNSIIGDLLALSRLERDEPLGVEKAACPLLGILESAVAICARRAAAKRIEVRVDCPGDVIAVVHAELIEQALINLIGNAIQYSAENKGVIVSARKTEDGVLLSVKDQGYGIEEKYLERIFERFYRVDKGRSRQEGGTGLGLSIVKHIAEVHGGEVSVQSRFGEGSTFSLLIR